MGSWSEPYPSEILWKCDARTRRLRWWQFPGSGLFTVNQRLGKAAPAALRRLLRWRNDKPLRNDQVHRAISKRTARSYCYSQNSQQRSHARTKLPTGQKLRVFLVDAELGPLRASSHTDEPLSVHNSKTCNSGKCRAEPRHPARQVINSDWR
jgi:hypothetical protein